MKLSYNYILSLYFAIIIVLSIFASQIMRLCIAIYMKSPEAK